MAERLQAHVFVSGQVQGVFYRSETQSTADKLGIEGWVRNLADGRVEAVFEGEKTAIEAMVNWCHQGSPAAQVNEVTVDYNQPQGLSGFQVRT